jgi:phosphoribosylanthranilate isomerase
MSVLVKICGLSDARHVDDAVAAGADAVGFVFAASKRRVSPARARTISRNVPASVRRVAVMLHPGDDEWQSVLDEFGPDVLQTDADDFAQLTVPDHVERWPVYREGGSAPPADVGTYVYEGAVSGRGETVDWSGAAEVARRGSMILAGGLAADNVAEAMATVRPYGVDVSSAVESEPGRKDSRLIVEFIEAARAAEKSV